jgi:hypothetical protein
VEERGLIVEQLGEETLVFDTETNEAHTLSGAGAAEFLAADEVSRRQVLRKLALAGVAATSAGAIVRTIVAPSPAQAQSLTCMPACTGGTFCCGTVCVAVGTNCCNGVVCSTPCCQPGNTCCGAQFCCTAGAPNACGFPSNFACTNNASCCSNNCVIPNGQTLGSCA